MIYRPDFTALAELLEQVSKSSPTLLNGNVPQWLDRALLLRPGQIA